MVLIVLSIYRKASNSMEMFMNKKISVIVPIYRVEKYLKRCIDSLINQTYKNLEIILIDDGSDDNCPAICDSYSAIDHRIKVVHQTNQGIADARNAGLKEVTGQYITFVDPDDYLSIYTYEKMLHILLINDADLVMWNYKYVYDDEIDPLSLKKTDISDLIVMNGKQAIKNSYASYENGVLYSVLWNKLYKKELFEGITFPSKRIYEDEARLCMILYKANKIVFWDEQCYFYHQHNKSIVGKKWSKKNENLLDAYVDKLEFFLKNNENDFINIELSHILHMYCYTQSQFKANGIKENLFKMPLRIRLKNLLSKIDKRNIKNSLIIEIILFVYFPYLYYGLWYVYNNLKR